MQQCTVYTVLYSVNYRYTLFITEANGDHLNHVIKFIFVELYTTVRLLNI